MEFHYVTNQEEAWETIQAAVLLPPLFPGPALEPHCQPKTHGTETLEVTSNLELPHRPSSRRVCGLYIYLDFSSFCSWETACEGKVKALF